MTTRSTAATESAPVPPGLDPDVFAAAVAREVAAALEPLSVSRSDPPPLTVRPIVAARMLGIGRTTLDTLANAGEHLGPVQDRYGGRLPGGGPRGMGPAGLPGSGGV